MLFAIYMVGSGDERETAKEERACRPGLKVDALLFSLAGAGEGRKRLLSSDLSSKVDE